MPDINSYALGLELQLQSAQAFNVLDQLETRLGEIEQKAASIAPAALNADEQRDYARATELSTADLKILDDTLTKMDSHLESVSQAYNAVTTGTEAFTKAQEYAKEGFDDLYNATEKILRQFNRMELKGIKLTEDEKAKIKRIQEIKDHMDDLRDSTEKYLKVQEKQRKETEESLGFLDAFGSAGKALKNVLSGINRDTMLAGFATAFLTKSVMSLSAMMDAYATVSYRALGTQAELIDTTNELRMSLGATTEEGIKTLTALAHAGFKATDQVQDLAHANYMFTTATGVSSDIAADYQRRIVAMGFSAAQATQGLEAMSNIIRQSGLSAAEASSMIQGLTQSMRALHVFYGADAASKATKDMAGFIGAVKNAGGDVAAVTAQLNEMAKSPLKARIAFGMVGAAIKNDVPQWDDYFEKVGKKMDELSGRGALTKEAMMKAMHLPPEVADSYLAVYEQAGKTTKGFKELLAAGQKDADMTRDFNQAMSTFKKSLQRVLEPLLAIGTSLLDTIGPAFIELLKPVAAIATALAKVVGWLFKIPVAGSLIKAAFGMWLTGAIINKFGGLTKILGGIATAGSTTAKMIGGAGKALHVMGGVAQGLGPKLAGLAGFLGKNAGALGKFAEGLKDSKTPLLDMGGGMLSLVGRLATAHPLITAIVASVGAALLIVPKFFEMIDSGNEKVQALGMVLAALFAPLVVLYVQIRALWEIMKAFWDVFSEVLTDALRPAIEMFKEWTGNTGKSLGVMKMLNIAMEKLGNMARAVFKILVPVAKVLFIAFSPILWVFKALFGTFNPFVAIFKIVQAGAEFISSAIQKIWSIIKPMVDALKAAYKMLPDWLKGTDKAKETPKATPAAQEEAVRKLAAAHKAGLIRLTPSEKRLIEAHAASMMRGEQGARLARSAAAAARTADRPQKAEPVASRVRPVARQMSEADKKILDAHAKLHTAVTDMHSTIEDTKAKQEKFDKMYQLLEQYLPQIAEARDKGLLGPGNSWN